MKQKRQRDPVMQARLFRLKMAANYAEDKRHKFGSQGAASDVRRIPVTDELRERYQGWIGKLR